MGCRWVDGAGKGGERCLAGSGGPGSCGLEVEGREMVWWKTDKVLKDFRPGGLPAKE